MAQIQANSISQEAQYPPSIKADSARSGDEQTATLSTDQTPTTPTSRNANTLITESDGMDFDLDEVADLNEPLLGTSARKQSSTQALCFAMIARLKAQSPTARIWIIMWMPWRLMNLMLHLYFLPT